MASKELIPKSNGELHSLGKKVSNVLSADLCKYGIIGTTADWYNNEYLPPWNNFNNDYLAWEDPSTRLPVYVISLKNSKASYIPKLRQLNRMVRNNTGISDEDLYALGFPPRSTNKPTPAPIPSTFPEAHIEPVGKGVINVHFRDQGASNKAKPAGVHGVEIKWGIMADKPATDDDLPNSTFDTKTPYQFVFKESQRGKRLFLTLRWENTRGEKGNWSDIYETYIP